MKRLLISIGIGFLFPFSLMLLSMTERSFGTESAGQKLFEVNCARCHGLNAKGSAPAAKSLKVDPIQLDLTRESVVEKNAKFLKQRISDGHGKMPQQGPRLSPSQIQSLVRYIQSLQKAYVLKTPGGK